ncbi:hypothetical protein Ahia01_001091900, partial [Argonauta hians]
MNTINYQLSSKRCLDAGWTVCVPQLQKTTQEDIYVIEPRKCTTTLYKTNNQHPPEEPVVKFYDNGTKFFTIFADGTGNIFYPSGQLAILISSVLPYHFTYIVYGEDGRTVMAVFEHTGYGTCYHPNGNVRLYIDPSGGMEIDPVGQCRKKWAWQDLQCHAPPLQPIYLHLNRCIGMKVLSQRNIQLSFTHGRHSCRMNLGVHLKPVAVSKNVVPVVDENSLFVEEKRNQIESLLDKVKNLLNYSCSPKVDKILPPIYLTNRINKQSAKRRRVLATNSVRARPCIRLQHS